MAHLLGMAGGSSFSLRTNLAVLIFSCSIGDGAHVEERQRNMKRLGGDLCPYVVVPMSVK